MTSSAETIFVSYASPDRERVRPFCEFLKGVGLTVWVDYEQLRPGQNWDFEIKRALRHAGFVIAFISHNSINRRGYVQRELKAALDRLAEKLIDDIFFIPVLLDDDVKIPDEISSIQHISSSRPDCQAQIKQAIDDQLRKTGADRRHIELEQGLTWTTHQLKETWEGLPGYEVTLQFIDFRSSKHSELEKIGDFIKGHFLERLLRHRAVRFEQMPTFFHYGQDRFLRTNSLDVVCGSPSLVGNVLSVRYDIGWYGAGAAHPNSHFEVFNFLLNPVALMPDLATLFESNQKAFEVVQSEVQRQLKELRESDGTLRLDAKQVDNGTADWKAFSAHEFLGEGIRVLFSPYQVAAYVFGSQFAIVPYERVVSLMRPEFVSALNLNYLLRDGRRG